MTKEYKVTSRVRRDINRLTGVDVSGSKDGVTLKLNDAQAKRVLATGAQLVEVNKNVTLSDFAEVSESQAIPDSKCVDDYTNGDKNRVNSNCKVFGLPRYRKEEVVEAEVAVVPDVTVSAEESIAEVLADVEDGAVVGLAAGTYEESLEISGKSVTIVGTSPEETSLVGHITVSDGASVSISNVTLSDTSDQGTGSGKSTSKGNSVKVSGDADFTLTDSVVENESYFYSVFLFDTTGVVKIDGVTFGASESYHVLEWNTKVKAADGTSVTNCTFEDGCSSQNAISVYDFEDGATLYFNNNIFKNTDGYRFSNVSGATATIYIDNNRYDNVLKSDGTKYYEAGYQNGYWWSGVLFQAYKEGMNFDTLTVYITNNKAEGYDLKNPDEATCAEEQGWYVFKDNASWEIADPVVILS